MTNGFAACPKCGSSDIVCPLNVFEDSSNYNSSFATAKIGFFKRPQAWILKDKKMEEFHGCACLSCGYLEFYLTNPAAFKT